MLRAHAGQVNLSSDEDWWGEGDAYLDPVPGDPPTTAGGSAEEAPRSPLGKPAALDSSTAVTPARALPAATGSPSHAEAPYLEPGGFEDAVRRALGMLGESSGLGQLGLAEEVGATDPAPPNQP